MLNNVEFAKKIGLLLKLSDELHLFYYESYKRFSMIPKMLCGGDSLNIFISNPKKGLKYLKERSIPFVNFCDAKRKQQTDDWKVAYGKLKRFLDLFDEVEQVIDYNVDIVFENNVMLSYFN